MGKINILQEFKEFAVKGSVVDMGVGIVIGAAFTSIVNSFVKDLLTPVLSLFSSRVDFDEWFIVLKPGIEGGPYSSIEEAHADMAVTLNHGAFLNNAISFIIVAIILFLFLRTINKMRRPVKVATDPIKVKECPYCFSSISTKATKCPNCTSDLKD